jgi:hypothetical protein
VLAVRWHRLLQGIHPWSEEKDGPTLYSACCSVCHSERSRDGRPLVSGGEADEDGGVGRVEL